MGRGSDKGRPALPVRAGIGQRVREHRVRLGLTQAQVGEPVYRAGYISNVEHGRVTPSLDAVAHMAARLGVQSADLVGADAAPIRPEDALARAAELLAQALHNAPEADRRLVSAAAIVIDSIRRQLMR